MLALDTEDDSEGHVSIINFFDGQEHTTWCLSSIDRAGVSGVRVFSDAEAMRREVWGWLTTQTPELCWACNVEYDLVNVFGAQWLGKLVTLQYVNAGLLRGSYNPLKHKHGGITFYDTTRHWALSVEAMGEYLGLPKLPKQFESIDYCRRDTEIVWQFADGMLRRYRALNLKLKATLPSMALQFLEHFTTIPRTALPRPLVEWMRGGYYGGRVEVFRIGSIHERTYHYDFNSLFPAVMRQERYPHLGQWEVVTDPDWTKEGMAEVTIDVPQMFIPALPYRGSDEILYPYGPLSGIWTYPEIRQALADGATIRRVVQAIQFPKTYNPFCDFVSYCYENRLKAKTAFDKLHWKLFLNSTYGKFGQKGNLFMIHDDREFEMETFASHANVIWSAYVTSYARLWLLKALRACTAVYYTDTDSIFTPDILPTGTDLGRLKLEGEYQECEFVGNKIYVLDGKAKAKGIRGAGPAMDFIRTGRAVYRKPARYRESRKTFAQANVWYEVEKHFSKAYTKRRVLPGEPMTQPWHVLDYLREVDA